MVFMNLNSLIISNARANQKIIDSVNEHLYLMRCEHEIESQKSSMQQQAVHFAGQVLEHLRHILQLHS